jgi:cysteine-rich repeat protein
VTAALADLHRLTRPLPWRKIVGMNRWRGRAAALWFAGLACTAETEGVETFGSGASGSDTASDTTSTGTDGTGTDASTTTDPGTDSTTDGTGTVTEDAATGTTEPTPECGNGVVEGAEECDDGNDSDFDGCLTTCELPSCEDGTHNGHETDEDCGGPCAPCALCAGCSIDDDCESGTCNAFQQCGFTARIEIDAVDNCWSTTPHANDVVIEDVPAGRYLATAVQSAWTAWPPPWNPPETGWSYFSLCVGFELTQLRTPPDTRYGNANQAYANLMAYTEEFDFPGGSLSCGRQDTTCIDNQGRVIFDVSLLCPER